MHCGKVFPRRGSLTLHSDHEKILKAINKRAVQISTIEGMTLQETTLLGLLNHFQAFGSRGIYQVWLMITGVYPTKFQFEEFESSILIDGPAQAAENLIQSRVKDLTMTTIMMEMDIVSYEGHLYDITHTSDAPYLTGIQRVVREIYRAAEPYGIHGMKFENAYGLFRIASLHKPEQVAAEFDETNKEITLLGIMLKIYHNLSKNLLGRLLINMLREPAKKLRAKIVLREAVSSIRSGNSIYKENIYLIGKSVTMPEIPASLHHIYVYEGLLNKKLVNLQLVLYDFIPFFHAWTVHPGNRGHLNSYIRLAFLSDHVVCISNLVYEQASLILKAFALERSEWKTRTQKISYLALPSGIKPSFAKEFNKESNLVVMAGSLEPRKNHLMFLDALEIINQQGVSVKARILGGAGWNNEQILARVTKLQNRGVDIVRIHPSDLEMREWIGKAQLLLQLSESEGFGLPVAEALALGTKVIVSDIRPLNEWHNERVEKVSLGQPQILAELITTALKNPESEGVPVLTEETWDLWAKMLFELK